MTPGLYDDEFFDFEAASTPVPSNGYQASVFNDMLDFQVFSSSRLSSHPTLLYSPMVNLNNNIAQTATARTGEELRVMPLTDSEIKSILAIRAAKERNCSGSMLDQEPKPDTAWFDNDDLNTVHHGFESSDANFALEQTQFQDPADLGPSGLQEFG